MGGQQKNIPHIHSRRNEMMMGLTVSQKPAGLDLMQNCDLPPPSKVFLGSDNRVLLSMNRACNFVGKEQDSKDFVIYENECDSVKLELLKALRSSQTRAREEEKKAASLCKERDCLTNAFLKEATQLFAYRQLVRLLELQVSNLQSLLLQQHEAMVGSCARPEVDVEPLQEDDDGEDRTTVGWILALALSWGIGVGTALACRYLLRFAPCCNWRCL